MSDWSKDIDLETIKEYLQECEENDDYCYCQEQIDLVMHEYIRQKQVIEAITSENERLNNIINNLENELARVYEIELDYPIQFVKEEVEKVKLGVDKE